MRWFVVSLPPNYEEEISYILIKEVRKAFRQRWKYKFTIEEYGEHQLSIIIRGRNIAIEEIDLKDLFVRKLMIDKVRIEELKL